MSEKRRNARHAAAALLSQRAEAGGIITLQSIYEALQPECDIARNGILWAICDAKLNGLITKTDKRAIYAYAI